jgi:hypothetical protein
LRGPGLNPGLAHGQARLKEKVVEAGLEKWRLVFLCRLWAIDFATTNKDRIYEEFPFYL